MGAWGGSVRRALGETVRAYRRTRPLDLRAHPRELFYAPSPNGVADPGEVVWTWVPYEDDRRSGKDRPVLVVGRDGRTLLGLMLSSNPRRNGQRHWLRLGAGGWDHQQRASWVRLDRVLAVGDRRVRREGAALDRTRFEHVATELREHYGWR
ncbi:MAG TPA: type II toxin-antitoxin system PemK/MazF family toxin [Mycobacteriales bacterium]|nr:type II toxin-antitoxin system PemK/MazF family toxin [Mycobacteriales bacterium]